MKILFELLSRLLVALTHADAAPEILPADICWWDLPPHHPDGAGSRGVHRDAL